MKNTNWSKISAYLIIGFIVVQLLGINTTTKFIGGDGMALRMHGGMGSMMGIGVLFMLAIFALVILGIMAIIKWLNINTTEEPTTSNALDLLKIRYANGDVSKKEFEEIKKALK